MIVAVVNPRNVNIVSLGALILAVCQAWLEIFTDRDTIRRNKKFVFLVECSMAFLRDETFWLYLPLVAWIAGIFYLSSNKGSLSNTLPYFITLNRFLFSRSDAATLRQYHFIIRKLGHFLGYGILAVLAAVVFYNSSLPSAARFWHFCSFAIVLIVASADEFRQSFYPEREGSLSDVALDCLGGLTMILLFWLFIASS